MKKMRSEPHRGERALDPVGVEAFWLTMSSPFFHACLALRPKPLREPRQGLQRI